MEEVSTLSEDARGARNTQRGPSKLEMISTSNALSTAIGWVAWSTLLPETGVTGVGAPAPVAASASLPSEANPTTPDLTGRAATPAWMRDGHEAARRAYNRLSR